MRTIRKGENPEFWSRFLKKNPGITYTDLMKTVEGHQVKDSLRKYLMAEQKGLCCYCCRSLTMDRTHIEHLKPRSFYPEKSMDYHNMTLSCNSRRTCDIQKQNWYDETLFVSPVAADCEIHFGFYEDGRIYGNDEAAEETILRLNLNDNALVQARKQQYENCLLMAEEMGEEFVLAEYLEENIDGNLPAFADMIAYFYAKGHFNSGLFETDS